jgi:hypothetical protein
MNEDSPSPKSKEEVRLEANLRALQLANALIGTLGQQRDEARATAAKQMAAIHEAMRYLDDVRKGGNLQAQAAVLRSQVEKILLKATSA